ncbi:MAG TPA: MFS transporter [Pseudomonadales bacterium]|nr:MFS transporter [Pseudomonadales bacterium]
MSLATTALAVAIGWHIYHATGNPIDLALVALMQVLPTWLFFLISGWASDNLSRRLVIQVSLAINALVFVLLALAMSHTVLDLHIILGLLFLFGCGRAFYFPAMQSTLPVIVEKKLLTTAVSNASTVWTVAMTAGPLIGGVLLAWLDVGIYWLLFGLMLMALGFASLLPRMSAAHKGGRSIKDLTMGIRFVWRNPLVFPSITLDLLIIMAGSVMTLLPIYAADILHLGPEGLGLLRAMPALGSVVSGLVVGRMGYGEYAGRSLYVALAGFSLSIMVFALSETLWLSLLALFAYGFADMISVIIRSSITHLATPDTLRGRVNAVNALFIVSSNELGDFRAGLMAGLLGAVPAALTGALCAFAVVSVGYWRSPELRRLKKVEDIVEAE